MSFILSMCVRVIILVGSSYIGSDLHTVVFYESNEIILSLCCVIIISKKEEGGSSLGSDGSVFRNLIKLKPS